MNVRFGRELGKSRGFVPTNRLNTENGVDNGGKRDMIDLGCLYENATCWNISALLCTLFENSEIPSHAGAEAIEIVTRMQNPQEPLVIKLCTRGSLVAG